MPDILMNELKAALIIFFSTLDEKQRRLYAGYESLKIGHGGDIRIAQLLDLDQKTVSRGRQELLCGKVNTDNIRESGGGRKQIKKIPNVIEKIEELMKYETDGSNCRVLLHRFFARSYYLSYHSSCNFSFNNFKCRFH